jgi:hypothetical protein
MTVSRYISLVLITLFFSACNREFNGKAKPGEGSITYSITYPDSMKYGVKAGLMPKTLTLFFKDDKATFVTSAGLGTIQIVDLIDAGNRTFTSLFIDELHGNVGCKRSADEISENETKTVFEFQTINESKVIEGLKCNKAIAKNLKDNTSFEFYYYDKIKFNYISSPFVNQPNLLLEYSHTVNNLTMKLKAIKVDLKTPVDTAMFAIKGNYRWLNEKDYYAYLNTLQSEF